MCMNTSFTEQCGTPQLSLMCIYKVLISSQKHITSVASCDHRCDDVICPKTVLLCVQLSRGGWLTNLGREVLLAHSAVNEAMQSAYCSILSCYAAGIRRVWSTASVCVCVCPM